MALRGGGRCGSLWLVARASQRKDENAARVIVKNGPGEDGARARPRES